MMFLLLFVVLVVVVVFLIFTPFADPNHERLSKVGIVVLTLILTLMGAWGEWKMEWKRLTHELDVRFGDGSTAPPDPALADGAPAKPSANPPKVVFEGQTAKITSPLPPKMDHVKIIYILDGMEQLHWLYPGDPKEFAFPPGATDIVIQAQNYEGTVFSRSAKFAGIP